MSQLTIETGDSFSTLLELAADNDLEGFKRSIERDPSSIDEVGLWYVRRKGSKQIVNEHRTPLMVAAIYGSLDVLRLIISHSEVDVNHVCGPDKCTALHCAASGGSTNAADVVKLLLAVGADPNIEDANGHCPVDVILVPPNLPTMRTTLEELLTNTSDGSIGGQKLRVSIKNPNSNYSSSPENGSPCSPSDLVSSSPKFIDTPKKEYPVDPSLPDIKNSIYSTDEFRMFSFKVRPCSRAYSHDWTECPFVHPGENARRRDPRKYHYSCVPCPDFRKGACRRGDMCGYAHGVFECWLHPAQYRTRLCKDGTSCARRVCFFAHTNEELRPLFVSTGSAIPSPRSAGASVMDMAAALSIFPGSPSSVVSSPSSFNQPMSPSNGSHSSMAWPQPNVPTLHLPGSNLQSSRLRSSLSARDIPPEDLNMLQEFESQQQQLLMNDLARFPNPSQNSLNSLSFNRLGRCNTALTPSNLEELFTTEVGSSPRYSDQAASVFSPSHKSTVRNQFQQQQGLLSPINTNIFSPKGSAVDHPLLQMQASYGVSSPGRMSPRSVDPISPMGSRLSSFAQREMHQHQVHQQLWSLSSRDLGSNLPNIVGSPTNSNWPKWGSPSGKVDWSVNGDELGRLRRSSSFELKNNGEEPDLSWVQSLVKESPTDPTKENKSGTSIPVPGSSGENLKTTDSVDHTVLGAWLEQMQLDQLVA